MAFKLFKVLGHTTAVSGLPVLADQALMVAKTGYDVVISDGVRNRYVSTPPIGFVYTRYPGQDDPATIFPGTTWSNISSNFPAAFFRAEGGAAATFQGTLGAVQAAQNLSHTHGSPITSGAGSSHAHAVGSLTIGGEAAHTHGPGTGTVFATNAGSGGFLASGGSYGSCGATGAGSSHTHGISGSVGAESAHNHVVTVASDGGADLRPINYTIQIYKRTA